MQLYHGGVQEYNVLPGINTHVQTVCTRPSPPPILKGLGTRL